MAGQKTLGIWSGTVSKGLTHDRSYAGPVRQLMVPELLADNHAQVAEPGKTLQFFSAFPWYLLSGAA